MFKTSRAVWTVEGFSAASWRPSADVYRLSEGWLVKLDLAGIRPEDIELRIEGNVLKVGGYRRDWTIEAECRPYSLEISYHRFEREIELSEISEQSEMRLDYKDGMFFVRIFSSRSLLP